MKKQVTSRNRSGYCSVPIVLLLVTLSLQACRFFSMSPVTITSWTPEEEKIDNPDEIIISVTFSAPMERTSAEEAFSFSEEGSPVEGKYEWDGNRLLFTPFLPPAKGKEYRVNIGITAEDRNGNNLESEFVHPFSTRTENIRPKVVSFLPEDGSVIDDLYTPVEIIFSEAVDRASFYNGFSISPDGEGRWEWKEDDTIVRYIPDEGFGWQEHYIIELDESITDLWGNTLGDTISFSFLTGSDTISPEITAVENHPGTYTLTADNPDDTVIYINDGWESDWNIRITFSEPVPRKNLESYISLEPAADFTIAQSTAATITTALLAFSDPLTRNIIYILTLEEGLGDASGNIMRNLPVYRFRTDGVNTAPPNITRVTFRDNPGTSSITEYQSFDTINFIHYDPHEAGSTDGFFDIYMECAESAVPDLISFMENFDIAVDPGTAMSDLNITAVETGSLTGPVPVPAAGAGETVVRVHMEISDDGLGTGGIITLTLDDGFTDSRGNRLAEEWVFMLNEITF